MGIGQADAVLATCSRRPAGSAELFTAKDPGGIERVVGGTIDVGAGMLARCDAIEGDACSHYIRQRGLTLDKLIIKGGKKLSGDVTVSGSKNASLPIFISTILAPGVHEISNVPFLRDINTTIKVLETLGARVEGNGNIVRIDTTGVDNHEATYELVKTMRASVLVLGPAAGQVRQGAGVAPRRLRHRRPSHQSPSQGAGGHGGGDHP